MPFCDQSMNIFISSNCVSLPAPKQTLILNQLLQPIRFWFWLFAAPVNSKSPTYNIMGVSTKNLFGLCKQDPKSEHPTNSESNSKLCSTSMLDPNQYIYIFSNNNPSLNSYPNPNFDPLPCPPTCVCSMDLIPQQFY